MQSLLGAGVLVMIVADTVVGARLLWLARRTRGLPELAMGSSCLLLGGVGYPLSVAARRGAHLAGIDAQTLLFLGLAAQDLACLAVWIATWRIFRPDRRWAAALVAGAAGALAVSLALGSPDGGIHYWVGLAARGAAFAWTTVEAGRYSALLSKRVPLGLADPVVHDRIRLWGWTTAAVSLAFAVFAFGRASGLGTQSPTVLATTSMAGLVSGVTLWLAFVPPRRYVRLVLARARAGSSR